VAEERCTVDAVGSTQRAVLRDAERGKFGECDGPDEIPADLVARKASPLEQQDVDAGPREVCGGRRTPGTGAGHDDVGVARDARHTRRSAALRANTQVARTSDAAPPAVSAVERPTSVANEPKRSDPSGTKPRMIIEKTEIERPRKSSGDS